MQRLYTQNLEFRTFIPKLKSIIQEPKSPEFQNQNQELKHDYYLRLENLMNGHENASIIDIKMGTSTVTCNVKESPKRLEKRHKKDKTTTSFKLGMKIIGYVIKSSQKTIDEKFYKFPYKQELEIFEVLRKIFSWPTQE